MGALGHVFFWKTRRKTEKGEQLKLCDECTPFWSENVAITLVSIQCTPCYSSASCSTYAS